MRKAIILAVSIACIALYAAPASAGGKLAGCDAVTAPGGKLTSTVELTNDTGKTARFKVTAQVHGDRENVAGPQGRIRGRKVKTTYTLAPGEQLVKKIECQVPDGALGPLVVSLCINGPDGRENYDAGSWSFDDGQMPDPSDPIDPREPETVTLTGTVYLNADFAPFPMYRKCIDPATGVTGEEPPVPGDGWLPPPFETELRFVTDTDEEWALLGPEAWVLASLMWKADLTEAPATMTGYSLEQMWYADGGANTLRRKQTTTGSVTNAFFVLEWTVEGIEDPRAKLVEYRPILEGETCKIQAYDTRIIQDQTAFDSLLAEAGIILPTPPDPGDIVYRLKGMGMNGGMPGGDPTFPPDDTLPPDWMPPDYWFPWDVDFTTETVLALFLGEKLTTGYYVYVDQVIREDDGIHVKYYVQTPDEWTWVAEVLTYPFAMIAIPTPEEGTKIFFDEVDAPTWYYDMPRPGPMPMMK